MNILIKSYYRPYLLDRCLQSIYEKVNDANNIEIIILDDGTPQKYLDKITTINPNVKLCRDENNRIEIYYGPFKNNEERSELLDKLMKNKFEEAYELEFTQEEFDKRCNY